MAHVERRTLADGTVRYRARYRDPTGKERVKAFRRKTDADRFLLQVESDKARGQWLDPSAGRVTFKKYAEQWQAAQHHRPGTAASVDNALRVHLLPVFGSRTLASIRPTEVRQFTRDLSKTLAPSTVHRVHAFLAMILKAAVEDQYIARSPATGTAPPTPERRKVDVFTADQLAKLIAATPDRYRAMVVLAAGTGLRQGEAFAVKLAQDGEEGLDLLRRRLAVVRQVELTTGPPVVVERTKTLRSRRVVPLAPVVVDALAAHMAEFPPVDGLLFTSPRGKVLRRGPFNSGPWRTATKAAGVPTATFHWLRHHFASSLLAAGVPITEVQRLLGHATINETVGTYGHMMPDAEEVSRDSIQRALGGALSGAVERTATRGTS